VSLGKAFKNTRIFSYPLLFFLLAYLCGLLIGYQLPLSFGPVTILTSGALLLGLLGLFRGYKIWPTAIIFAAVVGVGALAITPLIHPHPPSHHLATWANNRPVTVEGFLNRPPELTTDTTRLYVQSQWVWADGKRFPVTGTLLLTIQNMEKRLVRSDRILFSARLRKPRSFANPGGFDYVRWLAFQNVCVTAFLYDDASVIRLGTVQSSSWLAAIDQFRSQVRDRIQGSVAPPSQHLLQALLLGDQKIIPEDMQEHFTYSGTAHILSISGLHIGTVAAFAFFVIRWILSRSEALLLSCNVAKISACFSLIPVFLYTLLAGASIAAQRSFIMVAAYVTALIFNRGHDAFSSLVLAAFLILTAQPSALWDISFQLSFMAVLGMIVIGPLLLSSLPPADPLLEKISSPLWIRMKRRLILSLSVSVSAILATSPLVAYHFSYVSLCSLAANLIVVPLIEMGAVPLGLLGVALTPLSSSLAGFLFFLAGVLSSLATRLAAFFAQLPFSFVFVPTPTTSEVVIFYVVLLCLILWKCRRLPLSAVILSVVLLVATIAFQQYRSQPSELQATVLDVGQGDAILLEFPKGKTMLVDGGGSFHHNFDTGENVIAPFLLRKRITQLDYLVLTHPHPDHYGGLRWLARHFSPREFWTSSATVNDPFFLELQNLIHDEAIPVRIMDASAVPLIIDGVGISVLSPLAGAVPSFARTDASINNHSLVIKLDYENISILLTGDIQAEAEQELLKNPERLRAHLLKVPHHGSSTSSSAGFLEAVRPLAAICSVGFQNRFHLPHTEVVSRYSAQGCSFFRTDRDGALMVSTDGERMVIRSERTKQEVEFPAERSGRQE